MFNREFFSNSEGALLQLNTSPIASDQRYLLQCPDCAHELYWVGPSSTKPVDPVDKWWFTDGDSIVVSGDVLRTFDSQIHTSAMLWWGDCPACELDFYVIEARLTSGIDEREADFWMSDFEPHGRQMNHVCELPVATPTACVSRWVLQSYEADMGLMHSHLFGPFRSASPDDLCLPAGLWPAFVQLLSSDGHGHIAKSGNR